jgi:hypothetical protein
MTISAEQRAEISRRNGMRSQGPRTPEGKQNSRMNALKHGMTAQTPVLPGEDPEAFRQRVDDFMEALAPRDAVERFLVERVATASWKIERADRVEAARLAAILRAAPAVPDPRRQEEVAAFGRWLLAVGIEEKRDAGRLMLPFLDADRQPAFRDGDGDPRHVVFRLEATPDGCQ